MFLLTCFVAFGVLVTSVVQADQSMHPMYQTDESDWEISSPVEWVRGLWEFDLAGKISNWKQQQLSPGEGWKLARPFGNRGPMLRIWDTLPGAAESGLRAGQGVGDAQLIDERPDVFLFLQKRW